MDGPDSACALYWQGVRMRELVEPRLNKTLENPPQIDERSNAFAVRC
jgi:hypothetical protein